MALDLDGLGDVECHCWIEEEAGRHFVTFGQFLLRPEIRASRGPHPDDPSRQIDAAKEFEHVDHPDAFRQFLRDRVREATVYPISGVEVVSVDDPTGVGRGFVVCLIPEGNDKPYRAELDKSKNYFQRIDDSFTIIQHSLLRTMFFPQLRARLFVHIKSELEIIESQTKIKFTGYIGNSGAATARELWVVVRSSPTLHPDNLFNFRIRPGEALNGDGWEAFQSLHPGAMIGAFYYERQLRNDEQIPPVKLEIELHSQHQLAQAVSFKFSAKDIANHRQKSGAAEIREGLSTSFSSVMPD